MKDIIKELVKSVLVSIALALSIFSLACVVFDIIYKGNFSLENYQLTKMVIGSVLVGLGFGVPTVVYQGHHPYGNRMRGLYGCCICGRLVRRCCHTHTGSGHRRNTVSSSIYHLVLLHALLQKRSQDDER